MTVTNLSVTEPKTTAITVVGLSRTHPRPHRYSMHRIALLDTWTSALRKAYSPFRRYEDASLSYAGIERHEGLRRYGLYDTVVAVE